MVTTSPARSLEKVYEIERQKWDSMVPDDAALQIADPDFYAHLRKSSVMPGIAEYLGDLRGKHVLEYGCGLGMVSVLLAKSGAQVTAFDLSEQSVEFARKRARHHGVADRIQFDVCGAESLPYADESFDIVFGKAILHHLDLSKSQRHLFRVLKTGGKAAFSEPMGMNPLLVFVRNHVWYPKKNPRGADKPLNYDEIHGWCAGFSQTKIREVQLLSMFERGLGFGRKITTLRKVDDFLLDRMPFLRRYCRYCVMLMTK